MSYTPLCHVVEVLCAKRMKGHLYLMFDVGAAWLAGKFSAVGRGWGGVLVLGGFAGRCRRCDLSLVIAGNSQYW